MSSIATKQPFRTLLLLILLAANSALMLNAHAVEPTTVMDLPAADGHRVSYAYEFIAAPEDAVFGMPVDIAVHSSGRQYYLDVADQNIKVFDSENKPLFVFGGRGQGPGEWMWASVMTISPDDLLYVWDEILQVFHVYDLDGEYLRRVYQPARLALVNGVVWDGPTRVYVTGLSLAPGYNSKLVHHLEIQEEDDGSWRLARLASFGDIPGYDPGLYEILAPGLIAGSASDLYVSRVTRHKLERYTGGYEPTWTLEDPAVLPDAVEDLELAEFGRVRVGKHARAITLVATDEWLIQTIFLKPIVEGGEEPKIDRPRIVTPGELAGLTLRIPRRIEFLRRDNPDDRFIVETEEPLLIRTVDAEGRVYAVLGNDDPIPVRGWLTVNSPRSLPN